MTDHLLNLIKLLKYGVEIDRQNSFFYNGQWDVNFGRFEHLRMPPTTNTRF
jgi:hypothetical protein